MLDQIKSHLPKNFPWEIFFFDCVPSTNDLAKELAFKGASHGTALIADSQTGGRGRLGRSFHSPAGQGIYMSVILRPACPPSQLMHLTCAAAAAMCDAVERSAGFRPGIKWTNDLVYHNRKLAGILTELSVNPVTGLTDYAIIGIGLNCCQAQCQLPEEIAAFAGSLAMFSEHPIDRSSVAAAMLEELKHMADILDRKDEILDSYRADCITLGKDISIYRGGEICYGRALDIDADGALLVRLTNGEQKTVNSGEVSIRGMYGYLS